MDELRASKHHALLQNLSILWDSLVEQDDLLGTLDSQRRSLDISFSDELDDLTLEQRSLLSELIRISGHESPESFE